MDVRLEPFLTIEEIAVWARCRDPDVVYLLRTPALDGRHARNQYLDLRIAHAAMAARAHGRNIERELWEAWGQPTPFSSLIAPYFEPGIEARAEPLTDRDLAAERLALAEAYEKASIPDQRRVADAIDLAAAGRNVSELTARLPAPFDVLVGHVLATRKGGVNAFGYRPLFPVGDYLLELLRAGRFKGVGNLPKEALARELSPSDWGGLIIALANDTQRLCVWRLGNSQRVGDGDIENVRVARDDVLKAFPADPPPPVEPTDEDAKRLISDAMASRGGFISQKNGARIVRGVHPNFNFTRAMTLTRDLTKNTKRGPRGPRQKSPQ
jgi:hypothetical protein